MAHVGTAQGGPIPSTPLNRRLLALGWLYMRLSGLALLLLALGHFAIQHVINDVHSLNLAFVAQRWATLGWRIYDALLLILAVTHGLNGLRTVLIDYIVEPRTRRVVQWSIFVIAALITVVGTATIIGGVRLPAG
jgi:succinate dehydrogenase / fumarate reductase, membrane anchor subunit